jgi:putative endopeptidase
MLYAWQGGLGLRQRILLETVNQKRFVKKYVTHIDKMLQLGGVETQLH